MTDAGLSGWFEAELTPSSTFDNISNSDHTHFRIYFAEAMTANRFEGWYSGESSGNNARPQLIVRYNQ
ncbi:MAG TPA: hypothetical protein VGK72_00310 [Chthoniobacterales bacterium]